MDEQNRLDLKRAYDTRLVGFQELMRFRIRDILLVSSLYDSFILGEEGGLYEHLLSEYMGLNLSQTPGITRVAGGAEALDRLERETRFDLVITTLHLKDMHASELARRIRERGDGTPLVLLAYDTRELSDLSKRGDASAFDRIFMWQGNLRILLAIIKCIEDRVNLERDTRLAGVQSIILIEDSVKFYSSYLPIIYTEVMRHSQQVIDEGFNISHKMLRMRARPKILLCETYDEAWEYYEKYHETILGIISDVSFPRGGEVDPLAGVEFTRNVKARHPDIPVLLQSNDDHVEAAAQEVGASFLMKDSSRLLHKLQRFIKVSFGFGDFVFYTPEGDEVGRARDLRELEEQLHTVPDESLVFHAMRNHFSNWLKARTEFFLAHELRPQKVSDFPDTETLRAALINAIHGYHAAQHRGRIIDFDPATFDPADPFTCIGGGSLGGKGRGLAFVGALLNTSRIRRRFENVRIMVPESLILKTDLFDQFLEGNDLGEFAMAETDDDEIVRRFLDAPLPDLLVQSLARFLRRVRHPLAVRSSSLLEDSQYQPFAGVYDTHMVPNNHEDLFVRLEELLSAIRRVYASTFSHRTKSYIKSTPYRLEEEKMGVIIQRLVGTTHGDRFYPDISGVARSHNFYPIGPMNADDGIAAVALGLGAMVVEGGMVTRFCPKYPRHLMQYATVDEAALYSQKEFYALEMPSRRAERDPRAGYGLLKLGLADAERDGVLGPLGSTFNADNNVIYDGTSRPGMRLVTFGPLLKQNLYPLAEILRHVLKLGRWGMNCPVELEFSMNLSTPPKEPKEFHLLQIRPMVLHQEQDQLDLNEHSDGTLLCRSRKVLGNGLEEVRDMVVVDEDHFDRAATIPTAQEVALFNLELTAENRPYLLVGLGRWGSADPWLGIPVKWDDITGARVIVESEFKDMKIEPSQGGPTSSRISTPSA